MKLLFDQNLSPRLVFRLANNFPNSNHVDNLELGSAEDLQVWQYAANHEYIIVTKDADFNEISLIRGFPPKVIWIRLGNCTTNAIEAILRNNLKAIEDLNNDSRLGILILS